MSAVVKLESRSLAPMASPTVRLGKDVLELLSTAMYVDPLVVYREYVQNAADGIEAAAREGLLDDVRDGRIAVAIDPGTRTFAVRDNGAAIPADQFADRMLALGGSSKRGTSARGFRGVGRLAGLGHAQILTFRSRAQGQGDVSVARWDGRILKAALSNPNFVGDLTSLIGQIVQIDREPARKDDGNRFFEVELDRVPRGRSDKLLSPEGVADYLSQIAPLPFHPDFPEGSRLREKLEQLPDYVELDVRINSGEPLARPHRGAVEIGGKPSPFEEVVVFDIPSQDGTGLAAVAWVAHHGYEGALTVGTKVKGLRLRSGNLQVGDGGILESIYADARFNGWTVGEVHLADARIVPNGRRDQFEANQHYANLQNHLGPLTRDIVSRCRGSSVRRSKLRELEALRTELYERLDLVDSGTLGEDARSAELALADRAVERFKKVASAPELPTDLAAGGKVTVERFRERLLTARSGRQESDPLAHLSPKDRVFYERLIALVHTHAANRGAAKALIDRMLKASIKGADPRPGISPS